LLGAVAVLMLAAARARAVDREKGVKGPHVEGVPDFFDIQPIVLPVIERDTVTSQIGIIVTLELAEGSTATMSSRSGAGSPTPSSASSIPSMAGATAATASPTRSSSSAGC
jgi:hypothetical protein